MDSGHHRSTTRLMLAIELLMQLAFTLASDETTDTHALTAFLSSLEAAPRVSWPSNVSVCQWQGVICNPQNRVESLRLPGVGLAGSIPDGILSSLSELRILSLRSNKLSGPLPTDMSNCTQLRSVYLQRNLLSGHLPTFSSLPPLIRLNLAYNNFSGVIPSEYALLRRLGTVYLQNNSLSGTFPSFISLLPNLTQFSIADNKLSGSVPVSLQTRFGASAFEGNDFCGAPLFKLCPNAPIYSPAEAPTEAEMPRTVRHPLSKGYIAAIIAGGAAFAFFLMACCLAWYLRQRGWTAKGLVASRKSAGEAGGPEAQKGFDIGKEELEFSSALEKDSNKLVFFEGRASAFDLDDLLRASAEVLGKGTVGTAYKATLEDGTIVVVKRLKDVSVGRKDFEQHMASLGNLHHPHLVPLNGYYYSKDEKLLLFHYMSLGSLSSLLHGNKGSSKTPLDWDTRLKIATGVAKGIAFLHEQAGGGSSKFVHGNLKSSNVLLSRNYRAAVSDYCLTPLFGATLAVPRLLGYTAPEALERRQAMTSKADVYSYGVLLLELLTGKAPAQTAQEEGVDLPKWVQSVVREEWTAEVFDAELLRFPNIEEEMVQILQVGLACVATSPEQRPTMAQVVKMLQDVRAFETDDAIPVSSSDKSKESNDIATPQRTGPSTPSPITP